MGQLDNVIMRLRLAGKEKEAQTLARLVAEQYREDPTRGPIGIEDYTGACMDCGHVFTDMDCQHEIANNIVCDRCYLNRGGR